MYYIYHIPGIKIGCSVNPKVRVKAQGYSTFEILEEHSDIETASKREIELQIKYGYKVDKGSRIYSIKFFSTMGKVGGSKRTEKQQIARAENRKKSKVFLDSKLQTELGKRGYAAQNIELTCPYCNKVGVGRVMYRHHFNRCKLNPNQL
jgi:hypothetical protein